jgi:hypothetical protein
MIEYVTNLDYAEDPDYKLLIKILASKSTIDINDATPNGRSICTFTRRKKFSASAFYFD